MNAIAAAAERWLPVGGYEGLYEVSNLGRVRSLYFQPPRLCKFGKDQTGYPTVMLSKDRKRKPFTVHRLVAVAFHGHKRNALHIEVAHLDGDMANPRADNLKWVSKVENRAHRLLHGTHDAGEQNSGAKLTVEAVREIRSYPPYRIDMKELAHRFGVSRHTIDSVRKGQTWRHVP